jgi:hypothetical protein
LGLQLKPVAVRGPEDFAAAFKAVSGTDGLINIDTPLFTTHSPRPRKSRRPGHKAPASDATSRDDTQQVQSTVV